MARRGERVRRRGRVDRLLREDVESSGCADALERGQGRVQVEGGDPVQEPQPVGLVLDLDRRWRAAR
jgi:hypothetical protein